ncbi:MAG TPA: hypothetical protein VGV15_06245, partial [Terriglobales bacterium]|nr:hypothetical protein [Terriglobales bacterium]
MPKRKGIHPLVGAATLVPLAIGLFTPKTAPHVRRAGHVKHFAAAEVGSACTLPFDAIKQEHEIDSSCDSAGSSTSDAQAAQNEAKNNFCATSTPVSLNFDNFSQLQQAAENAGVSFGSDSRLPDDRAPLQNILQISTQGRVGEGSVVRVAAFVMNAHYSNVSKGETVNCKLTGIENNDIHIVLGQNVVPSGQKLSEAEECASITAEISPHFRPDFWTPDTLNSHNAHLFRFTGQLFFDAAHRPCMGSKASPRRRSIWEVHPTYAVDICIEPSNNCTADNDENWVALSDFVGPGAGSNETRLWLPDEISREFGSARAAITQS